MKENTPVLKSSILFVIGMVPIAGLLFGGPQEVFFPPVLLIGLPLVGLSIILLGMSLVRSGPGAARTPGKNKSDPENIHRRAA